VDFISVRSQITILSPILALSKERVRVKHKIKGNVILDSFNPFYLIHTSDAVTPILVAIFIQVMVLEP